MGQSGGPLRPPGTTRGLTRTERDIAYEVFRDSLDYDAITVEDIGESDYLRAVGNTVRVPHDAFKRDSDGNITEELNEGQQDILMHELTHVWQFHHIGLSYIPSALSEQAWAWLWETPGSIDGAYVSWVESVAAGKPWVELGKEEQAELVHAYVVLTRRKNESFDFLGVHTTIQKFIDLLQPYIDALRAGKVTASEAWDMLGPAPQGEGWR